MQSVTAFSQTYTLPSVLFDSLAFETRKGRSCDSLQVLNERLIKSQDIQLLNYDRLIKLTDGKISALNALIENQKESKEILTKQFAIERKEMEGKIKKRNRVVIVQGIVILGLILLI